MEKELPEDEKIINVLVFGQLMIDDMDDLRNENPLKGDLRDKAKAFIKQFRRKVELIFKCIDDQKSVSKLYDTNYALLRKMNSLSISQKQKIVDDWDNTDIYLLRDKNLNILGYTSNKETAVKVSKSGGSWTLVSLYNKDEIN